MELAGPAYFAMSYAFPDGNVHSLLDILASASIPYPTFGKELRIQSHPDNADADATKKRIYMGMGDVDTDNAGAILDPGANRIYQSGAGIGDIPIGSMYIKPGKTGLVVNIEVL